MVDQGFLEEPRLCMGLNKRFRTVLRQSKEDEDQSFRRSSLTGPGNEKDDGVLISEGKT